MINPLVFINISNDTFFEHLNSAWSNHESNLILDKDKAFLTLIALGRIMTVLRFDAYSAWSNHDCIEIWCIEAPRTRVNRRPKTLSQMSSSQQQSIPSPFIWFQLWDTLADQPFKGVRAHCFWRRQLSKSCQGRVPQQTLLCWRKWSISLQKHNSSGQQGATWSLLVSWWSWPVKKRSTLLPLFTTL